MAWGGELTALWRATSNEMLESWMNVQACWSCKGGAGHRSAGAGYRSARGGA